LKPDARLSIHPHLLLPHNFARLASMRQASIERNTAETKIKLSINLDGSGKGNINTGIGFFDHMLTLFAKHGCFDLDVHVDGDLHIDGHHTIEDTGIVLGDAIREALGDKIGIFRYGHAYVPMDETLTRTVIDLSNRPYLDLRAPDNVPDAPNMVFSLTEEFLRAIANNLRCNLHTEVMYGRDGHHVAESIFKSLARALRFACAQDPLMAGQLPSTKDKL